MDNWNKDNWNNDNLNQDERPVTLEPVTLEPADEPAAPEPVTPEPIDMAPTEELVSPAPVTTEPVTVTPDPVDPEPEAVTTAEDPQAAEETVTLEPMSETKADPTQADTMTLSDVFSEAQPAAYEAQPVASEPQTTASEAQPSVPADDSAVFPSAGIDDSPFIKVDNAQGIGSGYGYDYESTAQADTYGSGASTYGGSTSSAYGNPSPTAPGKKHKKLLQITKAGFVVTLVLCMLLTSLLSFGAMALYDRYRSGSSKEAASYTLSSSNDNLDYKSIITKAQDSVVSIITESVATDSWAQNYITQGAGSGVIIKENGYILTCNHVIEGARKVTVSLRNKKEYEATIVGTDPENDLAVLKIDAKDLNAAQYGDSSKLVMGDTVVAIGNPLGQLSDTASAGIISSLNRELQIDGQTLNLLQTDASINPGNSGGGLFNASGNLIGIVVAKSTGSDVEGLGFATPINKAAKIASEIIKNGGKSNSGSSGNSGDTSQTGRVIIGINVTELSDQEAAMYGLAQGGVLITGVTSANAMDAGLQAGDLMVSVDGKEVQTADGLSQILSKYKAGDKVKVVVLRGDGEFKTTVELSSIDEE